MFAAAARRVVSRLHPGGSPTDAELVLAVASSEPPAGEAAREREAAFAELVGRYGPMVLGVCRRVLADAHAAEDAFQAVFLVLARRAGAVCPPGSVGGWLYGVAVRTARKAKTAASRRRRHEMAGGASANSGRAVGAAADPVGNELDRSELRAVIDAELAALPDSHRAAVVLCDLQGKTRAEAATELDRAEGTVAAWLARGRKELAHRLARRGVALPAAGLAAAAAPSGVSAELKAATINNFLGRAASESVLALAEGVMRSLTSAPTKVVVGLCTVGALLAAVATATAWHTNPDAPDPPAARPVPVASDPPPKAPEPKPDEGGFLDHSGSVYSVAYAPDGKTFLSVGGGSAIVWATDSHKQLFRVEAEFARFSEDGKSLFYLTKDEFHVADPATGKTREKSARGAPKPVLGGRWAAISGDGSARVELNGFVQTVTSYPGREPLPKLAGQKDHDPREATVVPDYGWGGAFAPGSITRFAGTHVATAGDQETACLGVWDLPSGRRAATIWSGERFSIPVKSFAWSPNGKELAVGYEHEVRVYDAATLKEKRMLEIGGAVALAYSKDSATLAVAMRYSVFTKRVSGKTELTAVRYGVSLVERQVRSYQGFPENLPIVSMAFSADGKELLCGSGFCPGDSLPSKAPQPAKNAKGLRVLNVDERNYPERVPRWRETAALEVNDFVDSVAVSPDGTLIAAGTFGGEGQNAVTMWDAATHKKLWTGGPNPAGVTAVAFAPDGKTLAATRDKATGFYEPATGKSVPMNPPVAGGHAVAFSPNSARLAIGSGKKTIVHDLPPAVGEVSLGGPPEAERNLFRLSAGVAWSPDGKRLALIRYEKQDNKWPLVLWGAGSGEPLGLLAGHDEPVTAVAWSKDGALVASGGADGNVVVWDAKTLKEVGRTKLGGRGRTIAVHALAFAPDGKTLAAAADSDRAPRVGSVTLIDPRGGAVRYGIGSFQTAPPTALAFTPDGKTLVVGCGWRDPEKRATAPDERRKLAALRLFAID